MQVLASTLLHAAWGKVFKFRVYPCKCYRETCHQAMPRYLECYTSNNFKTLPYFVVRLLDVNTCTLWRQRGATFLLLPLFFAPAFAKLDTHPPTFWPRAYLGKMVLLAGKDRVSQNPKALSKRDVCPSTSKPNGCANELSLIAPVKDGEGKKADTIAYRNVALLYFFFRAYTLKSMFCCLWSSGKMSWIFKIKLCVLPLKLGSFPPPG